jgi:DNA primase
MSPRWSEAKIEEIQRANDIVEVVSSYLPLKRGGKDFKACCPFHAEKTPSFNVSPAKQIFKCFGCGKGGSVFQFVMARENVTFPEAVRMLADRAGIVLEEERREEKNPNEPDRSRVFKTLAWAVQVFERLLAETETGRPGREYIARRGFTDETVKTYRLGLAPDAWDAMLRAAAKRGVGEQLLLAAGLVVPRSEGGGFYDRFRNRLIFPIFDSLNRPIAFGGRTLGDDPAKYLNSPETVVFNKSQNLYGLTLARDSMAESRRVIVMEGYTDCMMAHQAGIENVVATLGTSLTRSHVKLLKRYVDEVVLIYDGDAAGQTAADRAVQIFLEEEMSVRIVTLPDDLDPCDFLLAGRKDEFAALVAAAPEALEFKWRLVREQFDQAETVPGRRRAVEAMLEALAAQPAWAQNQDGLKRDLVLARMAAVCGVEEQSLRERLGELAKRARSQSRREDGVGPGGKEEKEKAEPAADYDDRRDKPERLILRVLLAAPQRIVEMAAKLPVDGMKYELHRKLYGQMVEMQEQLAEKGISLLWGRLEEEPVAELAAELVGLEEEEEKLAALLEDSLAALKRLNARDELETLRPSTAGAQSEEEDARMLRRVQEAALKHKDGKGPVPARMWPSEK